MSRTNNQKNCFTLFFTLGLLMLLGALFYIYTGREYVRGAWITGYGTGYMTPGEVDRTIAAAKAAKLNLLVVEVRRSANAYYRSGLEPVDSSVAPGFDPLDCLIKKAHAEGIKVHAWVSICRVWRGDSFPPDPAHLVNRHPDWLARSYADKVKAPDGIFIDPGVPDAANYTVRVVTDIARRYDIDGLHLDFIRYPGAQWGYSTTALKRYYAEAGTKARPEPDDPHWQEWRREQVTNLVRNLRHKVRRIKPKLLMSAATIAYGECPAEFSDTFAYKHLGQDWQRWLSDDLIDAHMPMNYRDTRQPEKLEEFNRWLYSFKKWSGGKPVFVGLAAYISDAKAIEAQVDEVRKAGHDGFVVFCFNESGIRVAESRDKLTRSLSETDSCWRKWSASCGAFLREK